MSGMPEKPQKYATAGDYAQYGSGNIPAEELDSFLHKASRQIDSLTFNRIVGIGFNNLTEFQQRIVSECAFEIARFLLENREILDTPLSSYSINGVSMQFKFNQTVHCSNGVVVPEMTYRKLMSTNLCYGGI